MKVQEFVRGGSPRRRFRPVQARKHALVGLRTVRLLLLVLAVMAFTPALAQSVDGVSGNPVATVETFQSARVMGDALVEGIVIDAETAEPLKRFRVLPGIPFGRRPGGQEPACAVWQPHLIRRCADGAFEWPRERTYPLFQLRIEADGYVPVTTDWITKGDATWLIAAKMLRDPGVAGRAFTPSGELAEGAIIAIGLPNRTIRLVVRPLGVY